MKQQIYYSYYVVEEMHDVTRRKFAHVIRIANNENLLTAFQASLDYSLIHVNACRTKKEAQAIADAWNESAKAKGEYAFE